MAQRTRAQRLNGIFPLSYMGVVPVSPVNFVIDNRAPTINDSKNFYIGDLWLDDSTQPPSTRNLWVLTSLVGNIATWDNFGSGDLETLTGNSGGPVFPLGNNINVVGDGTTINVVGNPATHTLTVSAVGTGILQTLTGNTGVAHPVAGNINIITANSTPKFVGTGSTLTLDFRQTENLLLGTNGSITSGVENCGYGPAAGLNITSGSDNTFIGWGSGVDYTTGIESTAIGADALASATAGASFNTVLGYQGLSNLAGAGTHNTILGWASGDNYTTTESNNILLNNFGTASDSGVIRIGTTGNQTKAFMAGVAGVSVSNQLAVVINSATGQLGTVPEVSGTVTGFLTQDGHTVTPTAGIVQISGANGIATTGTVGPNTVTVNLSPIPAFGAYLATSASNVTGDSTFYVIVYDTKLFDTLTNFNTGTGVFTAPVTGIYHFDAYLSANTITDQTHCDIIITTTSTSFETNLQSPVNNKNSDGILCLQVSVTTAMTAGDTAFVQTSFGGGSNSKTVNIAGQANPVATYFGGYLVH